MIKIYKTFGGYNELSQAQNGCWINVTNPGSDEIALLRDKYKIPEEVVSDILDADERPRIEIDDNWWLIILRIPVASPANGVPYYTVPLGIFMAEGLTISICSLDNEVLPFEQPSLYREQYQQVEDVHNFILKLFLKSAKIYLKYLKHINQETNMIEKDLEKSIRNEELNNLLKMEKCIVYFITSLKANELVLAKFRSTKFITLSELNEDLLEDAIIENKQALEMAQIYSDIQSGMMDAFASVISNNLNVVMKQLTSISIILMIPTLIASLYGMNVPNKLEDKTWAFPFVLVLSLGVATFGVLMFRKKKWF